MRKKSIYLHHNLEDIPDFKLPEGFKFVSYQKGYEKQWAQILVETGEFAGERDALKAFAREFSWKKDLYRFMFFIEKEDGTLIATATAWHGTINERFIGRVHWVDILPEHQGFGLSRPLIAKCMRMINERHEDAYLKTHRQRQVAVHLFLRMGWRPMIVKPEEKTVWKELGYFKY
ncbi:GNAT family N-acetyltransferase [Salinicoccus albus]|uniref:GNAT family N-acetyltransferase n=1 Tax=Salinicoccus albus TaxID=418756 RepID=UPI00035CA7CA|nr:GNAT family N-acetyltransferase [Salinicoccus albus]